MKIVTIGDAMIRGEQFSEAAKSLGKHEIVTTNWELDWDRLQRRRLIIEQEGPGIEEIPPMFLENKDADVLLGLFAPFSAEAMDKFDHLKCIGVARAGTENIDIEAAAERGIMVVHVMGRNAQAVSDFTIGLMLSEARNIARAHASIQNGQWQKEFSNSNNIPELREKTIGIIGFGYIGRLVAQKLSGFNVNLLVYDPFVNPDDSDYPSYIHFTKDKDMIFQQADFITIHARLTDENHHMIGKNEFEKMKPTAYLINPARSGLVDTDALVQALEQNQIAGAGLDVFDMEPIAEDHPLLKLDNVTLTTHIAGTTSDALNQSPYLLVNEVKKILSHGKSDWIKNPAVLEHPHIKNWLTKNE